MNKKEDKQEQIEALYDEYIIKLNELKKEQIQIINEFISEIEQRKIKKIRNEIKLT